MLERGCTQVQGYLFSRPLTADDALSFLTQRGAERGTGKASPEDEKTP